MWDRVGNPEDWFSHDAACIISVVSKSEISSHELASMAAQPGLCWTWGWLFLKHR